MAVSFTFHPESTIASFPYSFLADCYYISWVFRERIYEPTCLLKVILVYNSHYLSQISLSLHFSTFFMGLSVRRDDLNAWTPNSKLHKLGN